MSTPDQLLIDLAYHRAKTPTCLITQAHIYPFGGLAKSAAWFNAVREGRFQLTSDPSRLVVQLKNRKDPAAL